MTEYERTFSVGVPVERAWNAFTEPSELEAWFTTKWTPTDDDAEAQSPGGPVGFALLEHETHAKLRYRQWAASPDSGIEVTVVFEALDGGTRITMTQAGFGGETILESDGVRRGMDEALADLVAYLEFGSPLPRHRDLNSECWLGANFNETRAGAVVRDVTDGGAAAGAGLQPGDLLLQLGRGAVFGMGDIAFFLRTHDVGDDVTATWVRAGAVQHGSGTLTARDVLMFAHQT
jgi:uncharacterized protein YndB with AHSA1/START domain